MLLETAVSISPSSGNYYANLGECQHYYYYLLVVDFIVLITVVLLFVTTRCDLPFDERLQKCGRLLCIGTEIAA